MNQRQREMLDALVTPINKLREAWERGEFPIVAPPVLPSSRPSKAGSPANGAAERRNTVKKPELPRGIRKRGLSYVAYLTHEDGRSERRTIGNVTLKMAEQQRQVWMREIAEGRYIRKVPRIKRIFFREVADVVLQNAKDYKRAWDADAGRIDKMKQWWGNLPIDSITTEQMDQQLLANVSPRGACWSEATSNHFRILLLEIFDVAIKRGAVTVNAARDVHRYKLNNERHRELTRGEEKRLRAVIRASYPEKEPELDLALHTGVRHSNLYGIQAKGRRPMPPLQWNDVDFDWKLLRLRRAKGGAGYCVPLNKIALAALRKLLKRSDGNGAVIRTKDGCEIHSSRKWFEKSLELASIKDFRWHDLRHTFATRLRRNGVPIEDIALLLNHKIPGFEITVRYAHGDLGRLHQAVGTLTKTDTKTDTSGVVAFSRRARV